MNKYIKYFLGAIVLFYVITTTLLLGVIVTKDSKRNESANVTSIESSNKKVYMQIEKGNESFIVSVPTEDFEEACLVDPANIVDWNTDGKELSLTTKSDIEMYAYKSANIYRKGNQNETIK